MSNEFEWQSLYNDETLRNWRTWSRSSNVGSASSVGIDVAENEAVERLMNANIDVVASLSPDGTLITNNATISGEITTVDADGVWGNVSLPRVDANGDVVGIGLVNQNNNMYVHAAYIPENTVYFGNTPFSSFITSQSYEKLIVFENIEEITIYVGELLKQFENYTNTLKYNSSDQSLESGHGDKTKLIYVEQIISLGDIQKYPEIEIKAELTQEQYNAIMACLEKDEVDNNMIEAAVNPNAQYNAGGYTVTYTGMDEAQDYRTWVRAVDVDNSWIDEIPF